MSVTWTRFSSPAVQASSVATSSATYSSNTNCTIVNVDKLTYAGHLNNIKDLRREKRHKFVRGDIRNRKLVGSLVKKVDAVVNFAAESHVDRSIKKPGIFVETNVLGVQVLLEACRKFGVKFEQISTDEVYGSRLEGSFKETDILDPSSPYSASKAAADLLVNAYQRTYNMEVTVTRSTNNYGPKSAPREAHPQADHKRATPETSADLRDWGERS